MSIILCRLTQCKLQFIYYHTTANIVIDGLLYGGTEFSAKIVQTVTNASANQLIYFIELFKHRLKFSSPAL